MRKMEPRPITKGSIPIFELSLDVFVESRVAICFVEIHVGNSIEEEKMESYLYSVLSKKEPLTPSSDRFDKILKHKETQCWVLVKKTGDSTIVGFNQKKHQGQIVKVDDKIGNQKKNCVWVDAAYSVDSQFFKSNEFIHEIAIGYLVNKYLSDVKVFARAQVLGISCDANRCCIGFRNLSPAIELEDAIHDMSTADFASIILQVLSAIAVAQERIQLKHHDLHLGNIMVVPNETEYVDQIDTKWGQVLVPVKGYLATIIDYGLSSATDPETKLRHMRIDEELLINRTRKEQSEDMGEDIESEDDEWGVWGPELVGDEGYDVAMLVESLTEELFKERPLNVGKIEIVSKLQELVNINFTERGRPAETCTIDWGNLFSLFK